MYGKRSYGGIAPLQPRHEDDFYPTPIGLCTAAVELLPTFVAGGSLFFLDPGCGSGVWGQAIRRSKFGKLFLNPIIVGVELRDIEYNPDYTLLHSNFNYLTDHLTDNNFDYVIGNPPYKLAEQFVRKAHSDLLNGGYLLFLLRLGFLAGQDRSAHLFQEMPPTDVWICGKRPSFYLPDHPKHKKTDAQDYALYLWKKGVKETTKLHFDFRWDYDR